MAYTDVLYEVKNHYYHTEEAKELGRAFNAKQDPDPEKFYR